MASAHSQKLKDDAGEDLFLGVRRSVKDLQWFDSLPADKRHIATAISQRHDLPDLLGRVLAARGAKLDDVPILLDPTLKALMPDPFSLQDMEKGAARIAQAIVDQDPVAIFGDYDVDGASSSALLAKFFAAHDCQARIYIPDRIFEGYGPNPQAISSLIDEGAKLIVTVDCGITSHDALKVAADRGIDVVVIDHHQAGDDLPIAHALINPNRQDDLSGQGHLAAAGVVFLVLVAVLRALRLEGIYKDGKSEPDLLAWLDLVALATVCDVVPLQGLNRAYVKKGLHVMRLRRNGGLRALQDMAGLKSAPTPYHLGFVLGPRINAGGRIGNSALGAQLLTLEHTPEAEKIARQLDHLNNERKVMETEILEDAVSRVEQALEEDEDCPVLVTGSEDWHKGLVGLVASRLTDRFRRPSFVIAWGDDGTGTGSARSIGGVDIGVAVREAVEKGLLLKGGGHAMAAGVTIERERLSEFAAYLKDVLAVDVGVARKRAGLKIDGSLMPGAANLDFVRLLDQAGPFGMGNPTPRFAFPAVRVGFAKQVGEAHLRVTLTGSDNSRISGIAFRAVGTPLGDLLANSSGKPLHVAGQLRMDDWGGREKVELFIDDAADPQAQ